MKMLVVDDSNAMRAYLRALGSKLSFASEEAQDGCEAIDLLMKNGTGEPFDLALVDLNMPNMNGVEFIRFVRRSPDFSRMKIIVVTTENTMEALSSAMNSGADDLLMKPISKESLSEKLTILGLVA